MTVRLALALASAGLMSAALETHFLREPASNEVWLLGFGLSIAAALLAGRRPPPAWSVAALFVATSGLYALLLGELGAHPLVLVGYVVGAVLAYFAIPEERRALMVAALALWTPALHLLAPTPGVGPLPALVGLSGAAAIGVAAWLIREGDRGSGPALLAVAAAAAVADRHLVVGGTGPDDLLVAVAVLSAPLLSRLAPGSRDRLATALGILTLAAVGAAFVLGKPYHVDSATVPHYAAELMLAGRQPYAEFDLRDALARFGIDPQQGTHLEDLSELRTLSYPALSFLIVAPFIALGLADIRPLYLAVLILLIPLLGARLRLAGPFVAAAILGNTVLLRQHVLAGIDPTWILLIAVAFLFPERRLVSAIALGLAVADRQPAWSMAPFVLFAVWTEQGRREAVVRAAIAGAVALAVDVPFLLATPAPFVAGILGPIVQPLQPYGVGLVRLGWSPDYVALLPRGAYTLLVALSFPAVAAALWAGWGRWAAAVRVAGAIPLWLAWRSLMSYLDAAPLLGLPAAGDRGEEVRYPSAR